MTGGGLGGDYAMMDATVDTMNIPHFTIPPPPLRLFWLLQLLQNLWCGLSHATSPRESGQRQQRPFQVDVSP